MARSKHKNEECVYSNTTCGLDEDLILQVFCLLKSSFCDEVLGKHVTDYKLGFYYYIIFY